MALSHQVDISMREPINLNDFPNELLMCIFSYLPDQSTTDTGWLITTRVCQLWRDIALNQKARSLCMRLLPDRAQRDIECHIDKIYSPLPINIVIEESRLDLKPATSPIHQQYWAYVVHLFSLISSRIQRLDVKLRHSFVRVHKERIEELLALVISQPTLESLSLSQTAHGREMDVTLGGGALRTIYLPSALPDSSGRNIRVLQLHNCSLQEQIRFFNTLSSLRELGITVIGPLYSFLPSVPTRYLTTLDLALTIQHSTPMQIGDELKDMPSLRTLSMKATIQDTLSFVQAVQMPSLVSLKLDFSVDHQSDARAVGIPALAVWLLARFGGGDVSVKVDLSIKELTLGAAMSWDVLAERPTHRRLEIRCPPLAFTFAIRLVCQIAEAYRTLFTMLSDTLTINDTTCVCVEADPPLDTSRDSIPGPAFLQDALIQYFEKLHRITSLQLNSNAAAMLLPLQNGMLPELSELRVAKKKGDGDILSYSAEAHRVQLASLSTLAREAADTRRGTCRVFFDGVVITMSLPDPASNSS